MIQRRIYKSTNLKFEREDQGDWEVSLRSSSLQPFVSNLNYPVLPPSTTEVANSPHFIVQTPSRHFFRLGAFSFLKPISLVKVSTCFFSSALFLSFSFQLLQNSILLFGCHLPLFVKRFHAISQLPPSLFFSVGTVPSNICISPFVFYQSKSFTPHMTLIALSVFLNSFTFLSSKHQVSFLLSISDLTQN